MGFASFFKAWCPLGPVLVHPSLISDPQKLAIKTTVNGQVKQQSNTANMVLSVVRLSLSAQTTSQLNAFAG